MVDETGLVERLAQWAFFHKFGSNIYAPSWVGMPYETKEYWRNEVRAILKTDTALQNGASNGR